MAKPGRNDRCPCGSGKKYKQCCLATDEAAERDGMAEAQAQREQRAAERRQHERKLRADFLARIKGEADEAFDEELAIASNAALDLYHAGKLAETEAAALDLQSRWPDMPDGFEYMGLVHEKRGERKAAADCYRAALERVRRSPEEYEPAFEQQFVDLIARLDPPAAT